MRISLRWLSACVCAFLAFLVPGVFAGTLYIACFRPESSLDFIASIPMMMYFGGVLMMLPSALYAIVLTRVAIRRRRLDRPRRSLDLAAAGLAAVCFLSVACLFRRPIPASVLYFNPDVPAIHRPLISLSEAPLLAISILAGLLSVRVCDGALGLRSGELE
jgi:hypothetical protein